MSIEENLLLDFSELRWIVIACPDCSTEVTIDAGDTKTAIPSQCPSCHRLCENALRQNLAAYRALYASAQFKIRVARTRAGGSV